MLLDVQETVAVAARPAVRIGISFAGQPQPDVVIDAGRNVHFALDALRT